jgi:hypothetical protein
MQIHDMQAYGYDDAFPAERGTVDMINPMKTGERLPLFLLPKSLNFVLEEVFRGPRKIDLFCFAGRIFCVSHEVRSLLERLVPGSFEFHPVSVNAPDVLTLTPPYFYLECVVVETFFDWANIEPGRPLVDPKMRNVIKEPNGFDSRNTKLKSAKKFMAWREKKLETETLIYYADTASIKITEALWQAIDDEFPAQLAHDPIEADILNMIE